MNKEEEILAISRLVFDLTMASSTSSDLDVLLERLFGILKNLRDLQLEPRGAILLLNPRGSYFQVAQFGMEPAWKSRFKWASPAFAHPVVAGHCQIQDVSFPDASGELRATRMVLLPLHIDGKGIGYAVLFAPPAYTMSEVH